MKTNKHSISPDINYISLMMIWERGTAGLEVETARADYRGGATGVLIAEWQQVCQSGENGAEWRF